MANIFGNNNPNTLTGTANPDNIFGRGGNDQLSGLGGNDRLNGGVGNDVLNGGLGIDTADYSSGVFAGQSFIGATAGVIVNLNRVGAQLTGGAGSDTLVNIENLTGTTFNDGLAGNAANNVLTGLAGNDVLAGAGGTDQLLGGTGNDLLNGGVGTDTLNGGTGVDTADYGTFIIGQQPVLGATSGVTVNLNLQGVVQNTGGAGSDQLVSIENLTGSIFNDTLTGNSANNKLTGREGNDTLNGGNGNDTLQGDSGTNELNGGAGIDTASYTTATAGVTGDLFDSGGEISGGGVADDLVDIENVIGSTFNDTLRGFGVSGELNGGDGDDELSNSDGGTVLNGGAGNDHLGAVDGFDLLNGGAGNDSLVAGDGDYGLFGDSGNDFLSMAGQGSATMTGGAGADSLRHFNDLSSTVLFDYNAVTDSPAGAGKDTIEGFTGAGAGIGDQIDLKDIDANALVTNNQTFTYIGAAIFTAAGQLRYAGGILSGNTDADVAAEFEIQLLGAPALSVGGAGSDILL